jgi:glycine dehydrogenase subunit 1
MSYIPHSDTDRQQMLEAIGVEKIEDLFDAVPEQHRFPKLGLPEPLSEMEVLAELQGLQAANASAQDYAIFLGAGAYNHFIPSAVNHILLRGEFYTAYTPYQPEVSQGTLQAIFEYQSMLCALAGMEAANASHYDGATSLAEAVIVAVNHLRGKRRKIVFSAGINPQYREVVRTYMQGQDITFVGDEQERSIDELVDLIDDNTCMLAVSYPSFLGQIEDVRELAEKVHAKKALLTFVVDPIMLALFKSPGELGADMVVGEGQPLGIPLSFGGPYLGFFACTKQLVRKISGRIIGETTDNRGQRAFVMTLRPREQDIRREKATSNICTNQGLMSLSAGIYMSLMGKCGMQQVADLCYQKSHFAASQIDALEGFSVDMSKPFFKEFMVTCPMPVAEINEALMDDYGIVGGYDLGQDYPDRKDTMLVAVTEMNTREEIDALVEALKEIAS